MCVFALPMTSDLTIRRATRDDEEAIWQVIEPMLRAGETYSLPQEMLLPARINAVAEPMWLIADM